MSEQKLRAFADDAARLVELPDIDGLARRGQDLRTRRRTSVVAGVLAVALLGTWLVQDRSPQADDPDPVNPPVRAVDPYPGNHMQDLAAGTYELTPSRLREDPTALVTVPDGWNTWEGPNRFNGHRPGDPTDGRYNDPALERATWYVGVLVVKLVSVTDETCFHVPAHRRFVEGYADTVRAVSGIPGYRLTQGPDERTAFGHHASHLALETTDALAECIDQSLTFSTSANGSFTGDQRMELWVVDVDGVPITVIASSGGQVPPRVRAQLDQVVASIEFREPD